MRRHTVALTTEPAESPAAQAETVDFTRTGPEALAGRYLRLFWQPVARSQDLTAGRALPILVMNENLTLYRGDGGAPHALAFRCAHRGTQLSTGWVEGDNLRCFYHGWKYDPSGQCIEQPAEPDPFCQKVRIRSYPIQEYLGLVFAYLGEGNPPPLPRYTAFEEGVLEASAAPVMPSNYFNRIDNGPDHAHLVFVHRPFMSSFGIPRVESRETGYGLCTTATFPNGWVNRAHFAMPNVSLFPGRPRLGQGSWTDQIAWVVPVDDEHYRFMQVIVTHGATGATARFDQPDGSTPGGPASSAELGQAVIAGELRLEELLDRRDIFEIQDCVAQRGQGVIADRAHERLGRSDVGVVLLRKIWEREMYRLARGRRLTRWRVPARLVATLGPSDAQGDSEPTWPQ